MKHVHVQWNVSVPTTLVFASWNYRDAAINIPNVVVKIFTDSLSDVYIYIYICACARDAK